MIHEKAFEGLQIGAYDTQKIIGVSSHQITFEHFRPAQNGLFEALERLLALILKADADKNADSQPEHFGVEQRDIAPDHPTGLQLAHAPEAGCRAQASHLG